MAGTWIGSPGEYLEALKALIDRVDLSGLNAAAELVYRAWRDRRRVYVIGNGGSAATASHIAGDLLKTAAVEGQPRLAAMCLADNVAIVTAVGNDLSFQECYRYPLETYAREGDVLIAISSSGNSENIVRACEWAQQHGIVTIGISGFSGGRLKDHCDVHINFPSDNYGLIEDLQLAVGHMLAQSLRCRIAATQSGCDRSAVV